METQAEFMTIEEAAIAWNVTAARIQYTIDTIGIPGAAKLGAEWIFPKEMPRPKPIKNIPVERPQPKHMQTGRTYIQQEIIDSVNEGNFPYSITEYKSTSGGTTYGFCCTAKTAKYTCLELIMNAVMRDIDAEAGCLSPIAARKEILQKMRQDEITRQASYEQYLDGCRRFIAKYGFNEEDSAMLLEKYAANYRPLEPLE